MPTYTPRLGMAIFTASLVLIAGASSARAQAVTAQDKTDQVVQMDMFEVTTTQGHGYVATNAASALKTNESLMDIPQTVLVMSRDLLDDIGYGLTAENLQFFGSSNSKIGESSSSRGAGVSYAYVDDMPENQPFEDNAPIDSYEVIKGPAQVLYVNGSLFGVVLKQTKKPLPFTQFIVTAQVNDWGQYRFTGDYSMPLGMVGDAKLSNRVVLAQQGGGNWQDNMKDDHTVIFDSFQVVLKNTTVRTDFDYQKLLTIPAGEDFFDYTGQLYTGAGRKWTNYFRNSMVPNQSKRFGFHLLQHISDNWESKLQASVWTLVVNTQSTFSNSRINFPAQTELITPSYGLSKYQYWTVTQDFHGNYNLGPLPNQDAFGFAYSDYTTKSYTISGPGQVTLPANDINALEAYTLPPVSYYLANEPANEGTYAKTVYGEIYWSHTLEVIPHWVSLIGGWTWDYAQATSVTNFSTLPFNATVIPVQKYLHRIGAVVKPVKGISLYALQATSFTPTAALLINQQLAPPQVGTDNELGMKMDFLGGKISGDFAWFHMTLTNTLSTGITLPNGYSYSVLTGFTREEGVDGDVAFAIVPGWQLITNFYAGHDRDQNNTPVSSTFDNTLSMFTRYEFSKDSPLKGLAVGGGVSRVGGRWQSTSGLSVVGLTLPAVMKIHAGTLVDTFVTYTFDRRWTFRVGCNNILDQVYAAGAVNALTVNAVAPRTWIFSGSFKF